LPGRGFHLAGFEICGWMLAVWIAGDTGLLKGDLAHGACLPSAVLAALELFKVLIAFVIVRQGINSLDQNLFGEKVGLFCCDGEARMLDGWGLGFGIA
jgi:hypothetical protein